MNIRFANARLTKLCNDSKSATRELGKDSAQKLRLRLDNLDAAQRLEDLKQAGGHCEELLGPRKGQLSLRLAGGMRLVFVPDHDPVPVKADGGLSWGDVTKVLILEVTDYHG